MARYIGPKNKLARKFGTDLGLKSSPLKVARRLAILPGVHGKKMRRKQSEYGHQLMEKQKLRFTYGVQEKYLGNLFVVAEKTPLATGQALLKLLERRLDNVVYRLGFAPTRAAARQLVTHGHVMVNGKKLDIPSYRVSVGEEISIKDHTTKIPYVATLLEQSSAGVPKWLERQGITGKITALPERDDISEGIDEQLVVEYYSR